MKPPHHRVAIAVHGLCAATLLGQQVDAPAAPRTALPVITPAMETQPVESKGDAADDPAIWVNSREPAKSLILGTDKKSGLAVYDLSGKIVQFLPVGRVNNVDLRSQLTLGDKTVTLAAATQRDDKAIVAWLINEETGELTEAPGSPFKVGVNEPYGIALSRAQREGTLYAFVCDKESLVEQWLIEDNGHATLSATLLRSFRIATQAEGMVVDEEQGVIFICEETKGVWRFPIDPNDTTQGTLIASVKPDGPMTADAEGITIAKRLSLTSDEANTDAADSNLFGAIIVSSQGSNEYVVLHRTAPHALIGKFSITDFHGMNGANGVSVTIDGTQETDGLDICDEPLGPNFPHGILVVQDGDNGKEPQNFKVVSLDKVLDYFKAASR